MFSLASSGAIELYIPRYAPHALGDLRECRVPRASQSMCERADLVLEIQGAVLAIAARVSAAAADQAAEAGAVDGRHWRHSER